MEEKAIPRRITWILLAAAGMACSGAPQGENLLDHATWEEAESASGGEAWASFLHARFLESQGEWKEAIDAYRKAAEEDPEGVEARTRLAVLLHEEGEYGEAIRYAREAIALDPSRETALSVLAKSYLAKGETDEAIARFEKLLAEGEESGSIHHLLATLHQARGEDEVALRQAERAVEVDPERGLYHYYLAERYRRAGRDEGAEREYREAAHLSPNNAPILHSLGEFYFASERYEEAVGVFDELAERGYRPFEVHYRLVGIHLKLQRTEEALRHAEVLKELEPTNLRLRSQLADLYLALGRQEEGIAELRLLWRARPADLRPAKKIAEVHLARGDFEAAKETLRGILRQNSSDVWAWTRLSYAHFRLDEEEESVTALEAARGIEPENTEVLLLLGNAYVGGGRIELGWDLYRDAYRLGLRSADLLYRKGVTEDRLGRTEDALRTLAELVEKHPDHDSGLNYLGYMLASLGIRLDEAEDLVLRALEREPKNAFYRDSLGWVYFQQGRHSEAVRELERAARGSEEDPVILEHLADAYVRVGAVDEAARIYRWLLETRGEREDLMVKLRSLEQEGE